MTAELRNLPHIASMAFNEPLMLEPAYARVFFCALAGQLGISRLTDAVSGDSLTAQEAPATLALSGDDDGPRQARSYQVMNGIAVLPVSGTLVSRTRALQPYSGMTGYNGIIARLQQAASDPMVDGILLDMDTPGGMVAGAFDCADIIARVRDIKPVWALANDMNCSAGQLLASAASRRLVTQTARTGSIGVMMAHSNYGAALEKQGVEITLIYSGSHKVDGNPYSHLPDDVREGNTNISGVTVVFRAGEQEQTPPEGFESSGSETVLGTEVKYDTPITRAITSANIDRLRFTFGVQALVETTSKGDRNPSEVRLLVQIQRNGGWVTEKDITIKGKTTSQYLASVVVDNLPPRPFNIRMRRMTPDSTTDQLQNKTLWSSYTEIIDVKQCYPNTALVGVQVDSEQFGSQQVSRNYHLRGRILQVPSNYNPQTRQYSGIWDGTFKPAYSNNMAWCLWDMLTHPRYGMGKRLGAADVDKWALYVIGQYCDQSVPDGFGSTEPRITCNAWLTTQRKAWDVLSDFCSAMRCMPVWNGQTLTFVQDRPSDKVWTYNRSNVVMPDDGAPFRYSFSALKDRHNAVEVNWIDPDNGWETATELVEDTQAIARYGRNVTKMDAFGCTSRGQAHRAGLWLIKTELLETQTVDFSVGAEGLRHVPGDVIEICDDDYAGISTGGRVLAVNSLTRTLTLDREITLPSSGTTLISLVDGSGNPVSVEVQSVTDGVKVKVSRVPDGVAEYSVWGLKLPRLRQRLFRCVSIRENDDGTYAITAVQHVPEKEVIVDNGAHFDGEQSGTVNGVTPPAVQHLTAEVTADSGEYQVLARWDTPKVVKGVSFLLRLTVAADDGSERLVSTARTTETTYRFTQLALGNYRLTVRAVNAWGQQGDPASVSFRIAAPAAPSRIELTPGYFQITATPHLAVYDPTVQFEFWFSEKRIADIRQVETTARYLGTALYWIAASINIRPGHNYYFYVRSVNTVGKSAFVEAVGQPSDDASGYLDFFKGEIGKTHLAQELWTQIDNGQLAPDLAEIRTSITITDVSNEITQTVKWSI